MKTFYAECDTRMEDGTGCIDLHRFSTKKERDDFADEEDWKTGISAFEAKKYHKEQFLYWKNNPGAV